MKKILVLGCSFGTVQIVQEAKKMGLHVINADYYETTPTKEISDEQWLTSIMDIDLLEKKCREANIDGVICGCSDEVIDISIELCSRLNLPIYCSDKRGWEAARNKGVFKRICNEIGTPVPTSYPLTDELKKEDLAKISYPAVVKPVDMSANRGMSFCENEQEVIEAVKYVRKFSQAKNFICERKLYGPEWVANYVLANGEARLLYLGREYHQPGQPANLYSMIVTSPFRLKQYVDEVNEKVIQFFREAHYKDGIGWVELMFDERDKKFYLIEPAYRFSSETSYHLYEKVDGFPTVKWYIENALGIKHSTNDLPPNLNQAYKATVGSYHLFASTEGVIDNIEGLEELDKMPNVEYDLPKRKGGKVTYHMCIGLVRFYADNVNELVNIMKKVNDVFSIKNDKGENMFIRFTNYEEVINEFKEGMKDYE